MDCKLYLGDCLDVMRSMPDKSVDAVITDPPYGHNNNNNGDLIQRRECALGKGKLQEARPISNDGPEANEIFQKLLPEVSRVLKPGGVLCCCCGGGGGPDPQFAHWSLWIDGTPGLQFKQMIIWDKGPMGMGWHYRRSYETVLVAQRTGAACAWYDETSRIENIIRPGQYGIRKIIPMESDHPTPKPVKLMEHFIKLHTQPGEMVLDPFMGGGTTGVACAQTGRNFIGIDNEQKYVAMAEKRIHDAQQQLRLGI